MTKLSDLTAFVIVGGFGTRLREVIGEATPKPLAKIGDQPFLKLLLEWLAQQGIRKVVLGTGHLAGEFKALLSSYCPAGMKVEFSEEREPMGTGGAVWNARALLASEPVLVLNGDSISNIDLGQMLLAHLEGGSEVTVGVVRVQDSSRYGTVEVSAHGRLTSFVEKTGDVVPALINAGMYLVSQSSLGSLPAGKSSFEQDFLVPQSRLGTVGGFMAESEFIDIGTPESYAQAEEFFKRFLK